MNYRFVGNALCDIGGTSYERFGSRAQFTPNLAKDVWRGGGCFIPESDFQALQVSDVEILQYGFGGGYPEPSQAFLAKKERAQDIARQLMAEAENPASLTEVDNVEVGE